MAATGGEAAHRVAPLFGKRRRRRAGLPREINNIEAVKRDPEFRADAPKVASAPADSAAIKVEDFNLTAASATQIA